MPRKEVQKPDALAKACAELQALQRQRAVILKSRNMQANRLQAVVAGTLGYSSGMKEADRKKKFAEAAALIKKVAAGEAEHAFGRVIRTTMAGIEAFEAHKGELEKEMVRLAATLPVAAWVADPGQRGFGLPMLAAVVGECGDLRNYANPAKLWRRMGCAPWSFDGTTAMGSTWRRGKEGRLPAAEWEEFGYSPRRRSIAFNLADPLLKLNFLGTGPGGGETVCESDGSAATPGPYRARYAEARAAFERKHPDYSPMRCHLHGLLCMAKRLLLNLWVEWNRPAKGEASRVTGDATAPSRRSKPGVLR